MLKENNIWSGSNTFLKTVVFPKNQTFNLDNLVSDSPKSGSILFYDGSKYSNIEPGPSNSSLVLLGDKPTWTSINISNVSGILPIHNGGTGWTDIPKSGLLYLDDDVIKSIPLKNNKVLSCVNNKIAWISLPEQVSIQSVDIPDTSKFITLEDIPQQKEFWEVINGGTGLKTVKKGDLLYAESDNKFTILSSMGKENCILSVVNELPRWIEFDINKILRKQIKDFPSFNISEKVKINDIELARIDSDIFGSSRTIREILPANLGGTGFDVSNIPVGSILYASEQSHYNILNPGEYGSVLISNGENKAPSYKKINLDYEAGHGVSLSNKTFSFDDKASFNFSNIQNFEQANIKNAKISRLVLDEDTSEKNNNSLFIENNTLFFRSNDTSHNLLAKQENKPSYITLQILHNTSDLSAPFMIPYTSDDKEQFRVKRIDWYITDYKEQTSMNIVKNGIDLLSNDIAVDSKTGSMNNFGLLELLSGDFIFVSTPAENKWNLWITLERLAV
jgi:hypothetical protein